MTLLRELQLLLERTYGRTGVNFEEFLLDRQRSRILAGLADASAKQISDLGRVFLREVNGQLRLGLYYDRSVIEALEVANPQRGVNDENVLPFMVFLEELDHAVHASLKYLEGNARIYTEPFIRDLELQAKVDTYLVLQMYVAYFNPTRKLEATDRRWLVACVFDSECFAYETPRLRERYHESNRLGRRYVRFLERLSAPRRIAEIRRFRRLSYHHKRERILAVTA